MKKDMHYYGTFAMARAAGIAKEPAQVIATAAQYVDEAATLISIELEDGGNVKGMPTGHHMGDVKNLMDDDQRQVWVPFHFLPGNEGETFSERMLCQMDSPISRQMIDHHLSFALAPFGLELIGIAAHVYADTFAHYGFSGFSSRQNRVKSETIEVDIEDPEVKTSLLDKFTSFFGQHDSLLPNFRRRFISDTAENLSGALGHGGVATYPDLPFLWWCFDYEGSGKTSGRRNDETFFQACESLHRMFSEFLEQAPQYADPAGGIPFASIGDVVKDILAVQEGTDGRSRSWISAMERGRLFAGEDIEVPIHREGLWTEELEGFDGSNESISLQQGSAYRFFQAASLHRNYVLRDLLPEHGLIVL